MAKPKRHIATGRRNRGEGDFARDPGRRVGLTRPEEMLAPKVGRADERPGMRCSSNGPTRRRILEVDADVAAIC